MLAETFRSALSNYTLTVAVLWVGAMVLYACWEKFESHMVLRRKTKLNNLYSSIKVREKTIRELDDYIDQR